MTTTLNPAIFSPCREYRYLLRRIVGFGQGKVVFIMLNPSTADEELNDPTIRRCMNFTRQWGHSFLEVVNLFAYRATDPRELRRVSDPIGPDNDFHILDSCKDSDVVIAAWGNHGEFQGRAAAVMQMLQEDLIRIEVLGATKSGNPRHPLYVMGKATPRLFTEHYTGE